MNSILSNNPVNTNHPLNRGKVAWWLSVPRLGGGPVWYNLMDRYHATLSNFTSQAWRATNRTGGYGGMEFDGADDQCIAGSVFGVSQSNLGVCCWVYVGSGLHSGAIIKIGSPTDGLGFGMGDTGCDVPGSNFIVLYEKIAWHPISATTEGWHHCVFTMDDSGTGYVYMDGRLIGTVPSTSQPYVATTSTYIGGYTGANGEVRYFNGIIDDVIIYNRYLSSSDVNSLYNESLTGNRNTLNWVEFAPIWRGSVQRGSASVSFAVASSGAARLNKFGSVGATIDYASSSSAHKSLRSDINISSNITSSTTGVRRTYAGLIASSNVIVAANPIKVSFGAASISSSVVTDFTSIRRSFGRVSVSSDLVINTAIQQLLASVIITTYSKTLYVTDTYIATKYI